MLKAIPDSEVTTVLRVLDAILGDGTGSAACKKNTLLSVCDLQKDVILKRKF